MTRAQLLADIQAKPWFIDYVGNVHEEESKSIPGGTYSTYKLERGHVLAEISTNVIVAVHVFWVVLDQGEAGEVAFYFNQSIDDQVGYTV